MLIKLIISQQYQAFLHHINQLLPLIVLIFQFFDEMFHIQIK